MTLVYLERRGKSDLRVFGAMVVIVILGVAAYSVYVSWGGNGTLMSVSSTNVSSVSPGVLISFSADAYAAETSGLLKSFSRSTGFPVAPVKSGGSFADANQIAAGAPDDVFVSVALTATGPKYLKNLSSNWAVGFASDQMVIAYSNATLSSSSGKTIVGQGNAAAGSNTTSDWNAFFEGLTSGTAKIGIADPLADPAGLRAWLSLEAAGFLYSNGNQNAYVTNLLQVKSNVTGSHAAALVAPLESGQIQFLFIYKSSAVTDHLGFIQLDPHVNLGNPSLIAFYSKISYKDSAGVITGAPIILCITVPLSSVNTAEALEFVQYVVRNAGTLASYGLQPFSPARLYHNVPPPTPIAQLISEGLMVEAGNLG